MNKLVYKIKYSYELTKSTTGFTNKCKYFLYGFIRNHPFSNNSFLDRCLKFFFPEITLKISKKNLKICIRNYDLGDLVSFHEIVIENCYDFCQLSISPKIIIDCGAHIGLFSLKAAEYFPQAILYLFEPNPTNVKRIKKNFSLNSFQYNLLSCAVSDYSGESIFNLSESNSGSLGQKGAVSNVNVKIIRLRNFIVERVAEINDEPILLKIDIEGEETKVIPDILDILPKNCAIYFETHNGLKDFNVIKEILNKANFEVYNIRNRDVYYDCLAIRKN